MKKMTLIVLLFSWYAAKSQLVVFNFRGTAGNEMTFDSKLNDPNLNPSVISRSPILAMKSGVDQFNSGSWSIETSPDLSKYIEFTVSPQSGKKFTITGITCKHRRSSTGPLRFSLRSNIDNYRNDIASFTAEKNENIQTTLINLSTISSLQNLSVPMTMRIYGFNAEKASGTWGPGGADGDHLIVNGASGTLPVVVTSFNSTVFSEHVQLSWVTESEHNSRHFNIYKSTDGRSFAFKAQIEAAGFSTSTKRYTFNDYDPVGGFNYYQLVEVDQNGQNYPFGIVSAEIEIPTSLSIIASTKDAVVFLIKSNSTSKGELTVTDISGRQLARAELSLANGDNTVMLPLNASGVLSVARFESSEGVIIKKFIKN